MSNFERYRENISNFFYFLVFLYHIAEITISIRNYNTTPCYNLNLISPMTWLLLGGIKGICFSFTYILFIMKVFLPGIKSRILILTWIDFIINVYWSIIGLIIIGRDNQDCKPYSLQICLKFSVYLMITEALKYIVDFF